MRWPKPFKSHLAANGGKVQHEKRAFLKGACPDCGGIVEHEGGCWSAASAVTASALKQLGLQHTHYLVLANLDRLFYIISFD